MKTSIKIVIVMFCLMGGLSMVGCGSGDKAPQTKEEMANEAMAQDNVANEEPKADPCDLKFDEKFTDTKSDFQTKSIYVENFDRQNACWKNVESYLTNIKTEKGKTQHVFLFDCPHHTTKVMADKPELEGEFRDYCVARYDIKADGTTNLVKLPYAKNEKKS